MSELNSSGLLHVYHGSPNPEFKPYYGGGRDYHDYGRGLYCTEDVEAAREWACQYVDTVTSYVYAYEIDMDGLGPVLDLYTLEPIYWIAALAKHRFGYNESNARRRRRLRLIELFPVDCEGYELILGPRADDRYFAYLNAFIGLDISYEAVVRAMKLGDMGQQIVLKGENAYRRCRHIDILAIDAGAYPLYNALYFERERNANAKLQEVREIPGVMLDELIARGGL